MKQIKFACPHCEQHIACGDEYAGLQIPCPSCQRIMEVPAPAPLASSPPAAALTPPAASGVTEPPPAGETPRLHFIKPSAPVSRPAPPAASVPPPMAASSPVPRARREVAESKDNRAWIKVAAGVVGVIILLAVAWPTLRRWQGSLEDARAKSAENDPTAGQLGHIAELYAVLDATDPGKQFEDEAYDTSVAASLDRQERSLTDGYGSRSSLQRLPLVPPEKTADIASASFPNSRVNGPLLGQDFACDHAALITGGAMPVLALRQGESYDPDREILIFLTGTASGGLEDRTWSVSAATGSGAPQVLVRWKNPSSGNWQQSVIQKGHLLKLELGRASNYALPGKIYLSLPGPSESVVAGLFEADIMTTFSAAE